MDKASRSIILSVVGAIIFMAAFGFMLNLFYKGEQFNKMLVDDTNHKASSRYSLAYEDEHFYITPADVYYDIIAGDISVVLYLNGIELSSDIIGRARNGEAYAINALKTSIIHSKYRKVQNYDSSGSLLSINFIGE